jgi:hypothetical protein
MHLRSGSRSIGVRGPRGVLSGCILQRVPMTHTHNAHRPSAARVEGRSYALNLLYSLIKTNHHSPLVAAAHTRIVDLISSSDNDIIAFSPLSRAASLTRVAIFTLWEQ